MIKTVVFLREIFCNIERNELKHLRSCKKYQGSLSLVAASEKLSSTQNHSRLLIQFY